MVSSKAVYVLTAIGAMMMGVAIIFESVQVALLQMPSNFTTIIYGAITLIIGVIFFVAGGVQLLEESGVMKKPA